MKDDASSVRDVERLSWTATTHGTQNTTGSCPSKSIYKLIYILYRLALTCPGKTRICSGFCLNPTGRYRPKNGSMGY